MGYLKSNIYWKRDRRGKGTLDCIILIHNFPSNRGPIYCRFHPKDGSVSWVGVSLLFIFKSILNYYKEDPLPLPIFEMKLWTAAITLIQGKSWCH